VVPQSLRAKLSDANAIWPACAEMVSACRVNEELAAKLYRKRPSRGMLGQYSLAWMYATVTVCPRRCRGRQLVSEVAGQVNQGTVQLGFMYAMGRGTRDDKEAASGIARRRSRMMRGAKKLANVPRWFGVAQNDKEAIIWYRNG